MIELSPKIVSLLIPKAASTVYLAVEETKLNKSGIHRMQQYLFLFITYK